MQCHEARGTSQRVILNLSNTVTEERAHLAVGGLAKQTEKPVAHSQKAVGAHTCAHL